MAEAAEAMLQVPIARLLDVSSFVRCRALGALLQLLEARPNPNPNPIPNPDPNPNPNQV